ncbi:MAG: CAP domain-containing protein [Methylacidiphilales bacterium]|nr:CAP domain-containing protein [Candidatus Methylacidiphilales bacterium]
MRHFYINFLLISGFLVAAGFISVPAQTSSSISEVAYRLNLEQETFTLINDYRKVHRLPLLHWDGTIAEVARGHSREMATGDVDFGHDGFSDRVAQLRTTMIDLRGAGENVLKTDDPNQIACHAVEVWLHSPHHLENIRGDFNYSGMGVWADEQGMIYFTQIFVKTAPRAITAQAETAPQVSTPFGMLTEPKTGTQP